MRILLIEDDKEAAAYLVKGLSESGHRVDLAEHGRTGLEIARRDSFDAMIIDRMLPGLDGLSIIAALRAAKNQTPVLVLSALGDVDERVKGLKAGCDDYLGKPFAFSELLARLEALTRRTSAETRLQVGDLEIDLLSRSVTRAAQSIELLPREFRLLEYMMQRRDQVLTRAMLLEEVWKYKFVPQTNLVDVHMGRLRRKVDEADEPPMIHSVRGIGFVLRAPA